jgi:hypothetical protein
LKGSGRNFRARRADASGRDAHATKPQKPRDFRSFVKGSEFMRFVPALLFLIIGADPATANYVTDPDVRPRPEDSASWRSRQGNYIYLMETADDGKPCRLVAVNKEGRRELHIQPGMDYPAPVK